MESGHAAQRSFPGERWHFRPVDRGCYVSLDSWFGALSSGPESAPDRPRPQQNDGFVGADGVAAVRRPGRLVTSGEVAGRLHRWEKSVHGDWIAIVSFVVPFVDDPRPGQRADFVPVAAHVVRARDAGSPGPRPPAPVEAPSSS